MLDSTMLQATMHIYIYINICEYIRLNSESIFDYCFYWFSARVKIIISVQKHYV